MIEMRTDSETVTSSIEADASPDLILLLLSDPRRIPQWAPGFADRVEVDESGSWRVVKGEKTFPIEVVVCRPARSVDYLRQITLDRKAGAFLRVLPRPSDGSVIVMTLPVSPGASADETLTILDQELQQLKELCASL
jgi:hypothetical protein